MQTNHHDYSYKLTQPRYPTGTSGSIILNFIKTTNGTSQEWLSPKYRSHFIETKLPTWGRKWQPTPVLLPGESHGRRSLVGYIQSMGSWRIGHDWATSLSLFTLMHWRRKWQPTPVFLPGESQGQRSLVGCCLWGRTESDTTEVT